MIPTEIALQSLAAGLIATVACGLGALPLAFRRLDPRRHIGVGFGFAAGLMFSASVYNLLLPALTLDGQGMTSRTLVMVVFGILLGSGFLAATNTYLSPERLQTGFWSRWGGRTQILIFVAMCIHSIPEGVAVGVGYASDAVHDAQLGTYIAVAIAIHNIPEGLAVAMPLRAAGASIGRCFLAACLTSLPQPLAAVPASVASYLFTPLMPTLMGFAAGAMIFLCILELLPEAFEESRPVRIAWAFTFGFCAMILVQVML